MRHKLNEWISNKFNINNKFIVFIWVLLFILKIYQTYTISGQPIIYNIYTDCPPLDSIDFERLITDYGDLHK